MTMSVFCQYCFGWVIRPLCMNIWQPSYLFDIPTFPSPRMEGAECCFSTCTLEYQGRCLLWFVYDGHEQEEHPWSQLSVCISNEWSIG